MTFTEAIGVTVDKDTKTGEPLTHSEIYRRAIEFLGGLDKVSDYVPFTTKELRTKMQKDPHFNQTRDYRIWIAAAGFTNIRKPGAPEQNIPNGFGLWPLYHEHGITSAAPSQGVSLLKEAARMIIEQEKNKEEQ